MKIVHVLDPFTGGLATFLKLLTEELNGDHHIIVHGERKDLAGMKDVRKIFLGGNVHFVHWSSVQREIRIIKDIRAYFQLVCILRRFKDADVIHLHSSKAGFLGRLACWQLGIRKVIYTPNGAAFLRKDVGPLKLKLYEYLEKLASRFGGWIICASASERNEYEKRGMNASYISNGTRISVESFLTNKDYNKFRIVTSGRVSDQKNPAFFNQIATALSHLKHFGFTWIGAGEDTSLLTSPNIRVTGWLSDKQVRQEVAKADLYLSTSFFEGLPFAVIEAMSLQKCLLLSDCIGNRDLVKKGVNGELFRTAEEAINHILYFYLHKEIVESMGLNSLEICRDYFNIADTARLYRYQYERLNGIEHEEILTRAKLREMRVSREYIVAEE